MQKTSDSDCSSAHCNFGSYRQQLVSADYCSVDAARYFIYIVRGGKVVVLKRKPVPNLYAKRKHPQGDNLFT